MKNHEKTVEELLLELHDLDKKANSSPRKLVADQNGNFLLDPKNPEDMEWFKNDEDYDVI